MNPSICDLLYNNSGYSGTKMWINNIDYLVNLFIPGIPLLWKDYCLYFVI